MLNLSDIDNVVKKVNKTYNTQYEYRIDQTDLNEDQKSRFENKYFSVLKITNKNLDFDGWKIHINIFHENARNIDMLSLYDSLVEAWIEQTYENYKVSKEWIF